MDAFGAVIAFTGALLILTSLFKKKPPRLDFNTGEPDTDDDDDFYRLLNYVRKIKMYIGIMFLVTGAGIIIFL